MASTTSVITRAKKYNGDDFNIARGLTHSCSVCQKSFIAPSHLEIHFRVHTGERPFKYKISQLSFKSPGQLTVHLTTHSNETHFICLFCEKAFKTVKELSQHMAVHTKEKPHYCSKCSASFSSAGGLTQHIVVQHGPKKGKKCDHCPSMFYNITNKDGHGSCTRQTSRNIFCFVVFFALIPNLKTVYPPGPPVLSYRRSNLPDW